MRTLRELIERNARYFPNREAFVCGDRRLTHAGLAQRSLRLASGLYELGLRRQDRVALLAMNCLEFYETYGAAEVAGYIAAPINYRLAPAEIAYMLRDSTAKILIFEAQYAAVVAALRNELREIQHYICIDSGAAGRPEWALAALGASLFLFVAAVAYPAGMGMGDVKLALLLGAMLGRTVPVALMLGMVAALVPSLVLVARHGARARKMGIPFAPFLALGGVVALFVGHWLLHAYLAV